MKRLDAGHLKCDVARIDRVIAPEIAFGFEVHDRIARENSALRSILNALVDGWDELARNHATDNRIGELVTGAMR
jgi:hypothetical protein